MILGLEVDRMNAGPNSADRVLQTLLSVDDLTRRWGVSRASIDRWAASGRIPRPIALGGLRRWRLLDVLAFEGQGLGQVQPLSMPAVVV